MESDLMSLFSFGSAAEEAMLDGFDPSSVLTPRTVEEWVSEQRNLTEQGAEEQAEDAACAEMVAEISTRQQQDRESNVVILSDVIVKKASPAAGCGGGGGGKLEKLLKMPALRSLSLKKKQKKNTARVPPTDQPTSSAASTAEIIVVEGDEETEHRLSFKRPQSPLAIKALKKRRIENIASGEGEPQWLGEFTPSQRDALAAALKVRQTIISEMEQSESVVTDCDRQILILRQKMKAAQEKVAKCKQRLKHFSHFPYSAEM